MRAVNEKVSMSTTADRAAVDVASVNTSSSSSSGFRARRARRRQARRYDTITTLASGNRRFTHCWSNTPSLCGAKVNKIPQIVLSSPSHA